MGLLLDAFEPAFMQRALIGSLVAVVATSVVGTWVVLRGLAFLGDALAHGVIPGLALAVLWGTSPIVGALVAAFVMSGLVTVLSNRSTVREDTAIGLLFVGMLSLGIVLISRSDAFSQDVTAVLFGDVLGVSFEDVRGQMVAAAIVVSVSALLHRAFLALTFNRDKAHTLGMHPALTQGVLLALVAVSIVASFRAVGTLLVFGLLVGPPATASLVVRRIPLVMVGAVVLGASAVVLGLVVSFHHGTAGGATMAGLCVAQFFAVLLVRDGLRAIRARGKRTIVAD